MPATESAVQSHGTPEQYRLKTGGWIEVRYGYVYDTRTRRELATRDNAADFILKHCQLEEWERELIDYWKRDAWKHTGESSRVPNVQKRHWEYKTQKEREAAE